MRYESEKLGFSFELPEGWRRDEHNVLPTFYGPQGGPGVRTQVIQMQIGSILAQYRTPEARERFLAEPGAEIARSTVGDEQNVVVMKKQDHSELSIVRDDVHYNITHSHDSATLEAMESLRGTARFGTGLQARVAKISASNPKTQAMSRALRAKSPEEARQILEEAGMPDQSTGQGYTLHARTPTRGAGDTPRRWWQFWK